jgi:hypothetical protein
MIVSSSTMINKAALIISSRLFFISPLTYRSLYPQVNSFTIMSASSSSAAGDASGGSGRRIISIDIISDT